FPSEVMPKKVLTASVIEVLIAIPSLYNIPCGAPLVMLKKSALIPAHTLCPTASSYVACFVICCIPKAGWLLGVETSILIVGSDRSTSKTKAFMDSPVEERYWISVASTPVVTVYDVSELMLATKSVLFVIAIPTVVLGIAT